MNVLAVFAHPDDETLACGATLSKHAAAGDDVTVIVATDGVRSRTSNDHAAIKRRRDAFWSACRCYDAAEVIGPFVDQWLDTEPLLKIAQWIEGHIQAHDPEVVYTHHRGDLNRDHQIIAEAVLVAARPQSTCRVRRICAGEIPSSTEWAGPSTFQPTVFVDVSGEPLIQKFRAWAYYVDEHREAPHPRSGDSILQLAKWRGACVGVRAAEAFQLLREIR